MNSRTSSVKWWGVGSALLMIVGGLGPWVVVGAKTLAHGTSNDGALLIGLGVVAGGLLLWRGGSARWPAIVALVLGVLGTVITIADIGSVSGDSFAAAIADPGWGLYLDLAASISLAVAGLVLLVLGRRPATAASAA